MSRRQGGVLGWALLGSLLAHGVAILALPQKARSEPRGEPLAEPVTVEIWAKALPDRAGDGSRGLSESTTGRVIPHSEVARAGRPMWILGIAPPEPASPKASAPAAKGPAVKASAASASDTRTSDASASGAGTSDASASGTSDSPAGALEQGARGTAEVSPSGRSSPAALGDAAGAAVGGSSGSLPAGTRADSPEAGAGLAEKTSSANAAALHRRLEASARACYPPAARAFRLRGSAPVRFCLDGKGGVETVSLLGSTGSPLLDRAVKDCVLPGALPLPGTGCYAVTVNFTDR